MKSTIPVVAKIDQIVGHPADLGVLRNGTIAVERGTAGRISPREVRKKGIDMVEPGLQPRCDLCGSSDPPRLNVYRKKGRRLKLCGNCNSKKEGRILKSILLGSRVYGSKISKIAEDTELSKEEVENALRRLLSSGLVSRDKTRKPTRWFPDW